MTHTHANARTHTGDNSGGNSKAIKVIRIVKPLRLFKLLRVLRAMKVWPQILNPEPKILKPEPDGARREGVRV